MKLLTKIPTPRTEVLILLFIVLAFAAGYMLSRVQMPVSTDEIKRLERINDSLVKEVNQARAQQSMWAERIDSLRELIDQTEADIRVIRDIYERKVYIYDTFSIDQLERYFADRYPR